MWAAGWTARVPVLEPELVPVLVLVQESAQAQEPV
ncbi:hypothetical protein FHT39_000295 [Mitsuaria sp. BK045]|nr:hypothetical protein [Mitsuaria sp. BK041]MBB3360873.1 hypothetical protein [Mitsuaria sp. BK045]